MTETPDSSEARRIVDDLEEDIVDVDKAAGEDRAGADASEDEEAVDRADEVPGSPEPPA